MTETRLRSAAKALTWRLCGSLVTALYVWIVSGRLDLAGGVGLFDLFVKYGLFYAHERMWERVRFGRPKVHEYDI